MLYYSYLDLILFLSCLFENIFDLRALVFFNSVLYTCVWNALWYCGNLVLYFSSCGTFSGIVEFRVKIFCLCCVRVVCVLFLINKKDRKKHYVVYFSVCGTRSGILCYIFLHMERALVFCVVFFRMCNMPWYFVLCLSVCGTHSVILCYISLRDERALVFCVVFFCVRNALWYFVLYFSTCGTRSGILRCIFLRVETLWYFLLYFSACGTRSGDF